MAYAWQYDRGLHKIAMEERTKYMLLGIIIGIVIGMAIFYLLVTFRVIRPFGFRGFEGPGNFTNLTMPFRNR